MFPQQKQSTFGFNSTLYYTCFTLSVSAPTRNSKRETITFSINGLQQGLASSMKKVMEFSKKKNHQRLKHLNLFYRVRNNEIFSPSHKEVMVENSHRF